MIQRETRLDVADNTGAKELLCIGIPGESKQKTATVGDVITCVVKKASPQASIKKSTVVKAVIVRTHSAVCREDGTTIRFDDNAAVIIDKEGNPRGTRILGMIARELRDRGYTKIVSLADEVI